MSDSPDSNRVVQVCDDCGEPKYATNSEGCTCDEPQGESSQESCQRNTKIDKDLDLPVAATVHRQYPNGDVRFHSIVENMVEEGDDLTPVRCAEDAIQQARQSERQELLEKIDEKMQDLQGNYDSRVEIENKKREYAKLGELRDELQGEKNADR